jgi:hypothetical protein
MMLIAGDYQLLPEFLQRSVSVPQVLNGNDTMMDVLAGKANGPELIRPVTDDAGKTLQECSTLTSEEMVALASGNVRIIEDRRKNPDIRFAI